jgi:hypothetical protein
MMQNSTKETAVRHVFITVAGGVAYVAKAPENTAVHIIDHDDIESDPELTLRNLSPAERAFLGEMEKGHQV